MWVLFVAFSINHFNPVLIENFDTKEKCEKFATQLRVDLRKIKIDWHKCYMK
jgi:hypothetical protein